MEKLVLVHIFRLNLYSFPLSSNFKMRPFLSQNAWNILADSDRIEIIKTTHTLKRQYECQCTIAVSRYFPSSTFSTLFYPHCKELYTSKILAAIRQAVYACNWYQNSIFAELWYKMLNRAFIAGWFLFNLFIPPSEIQKRRMTGQSCSRASERKVHIWSISTLTQWLQCKPDILFPKT